MEAGGGPGDVELLRDDLERAQQSEIELGARGITVNAVAPGPIDDDFYRNAETAESMAAATHHSPCNRLGHPEDIAPVVGWLVSEDAGWVSGQTVRANGAMF